MQKLFFVTMMTMVLVFSFSFSAQAQSEAQLTETREAYTRLYRVAPLSCRAPQCTTESRPRHMPIAYSEYQEAIRFLVAGARACLADCTCTVQNAATPNYCAAQSAAPPAPSPRAATPAPVAARPAQAAPVAPTPTVAAMPPTAAAPLPPYMPQGMFGGQSYSSLGYCPSTMQTISAFSQIGIFDAIWYSSGARPQVLSMLTGNPSALMSMQGQTSAPITVQFQTLASPYILVVAVNDREVVTLRNGHPNLVVQQRRDGGYCMRSAIPSQASTRFVMQVEGGSPTFDIEVSAYMPTASGALGAPISTRRATYHVADVLRSNLTILLDQADAGL